MPLEPTQPETPLTPFRAAVGAACLTVIGVACLVLVGGWALEVETLRSVVPGAVGMKALTALGLLCAAISLLLLAPEASRLRRAAGLGLAAVPAILGLLVLCEYIAGANLGIDELLFVDHEGRANGIANPGRFAPTTGVCFILTSAALLLLDSAPRRGWRPAEVAAVPVVVVAGMGILGYAYSLPTFYGPASAAKMAINTAGCFVLLSVAIVLARPHGRLLRLATTTDPGGVMVRRLGPFMLILPLVLGWLHLRTVEWGVLEPEAAAWWLSAASVLSLAVVIAWCASVMSGSDAGRRRLEQHTKEARDHAVELSRTKSEFVATMSHEIRTPLNGVIGLADLLLDTPLNDEQREYARGIRSSGDALMAVIGGILDVSKIEAGKLDIERADFSITELVHSTTALMSAQAREKGVALTTSLGEAVPAAACGDALRLRQVLLNLLSNAVKFTSEGGVALEVSSEPAQGGATLVRFEISDTGIGVPAASVGTLFDSYTQADSSTTRRYGGTGLGLAISKQLVELMGGEIGADSAVGEGSRFWFTVPLTPATRGQPPGWSDGSTTSRNSSARERAAELAAKVTVLVAEDNEVNQFVARRVLEKLGYGVEVAGDGRQAVALHASGSYGAILMDCQMPELDGYAATREIRRNEGDGPHTPIIAMTANTMQGDREKCLDAGMDDYVGKPLRPHAIEETVTRALAGRS